MAQKIIVDSTPDLLQPTLYFHQGDIGRQFQIEIATRDGYSVPSGAAAKIQATKPSGLGFSITGTVSGNVVSFASTSGMTDEAGRFPAQIEISSGSDVIYTANFPMVCQDNTHPASTTDGSQEEIVPEITLLVERAESAAATAGADAAVAAQAQVDEMMNYLPTEVSNLKSDLSDEETARIALAGRVTTAEGDIDTLETHKVAQPLDEYNQPTNGTDGQLLRTKGDGATEWVDEGLPTDAQTAQAVSDWFDDHPEATTTVQDGSLTEVKFTDALKLKTIKDYVTPEMFGAVGDGETDDTDAVNNAYANGKAVVLSGIYGISDTIHVQMKPTKTIGGYFKALNSFPSDTPMITITDRESIPGFPIIEKTYLPFEFKLDGCDIADIGFYAYRSEASCYNVSVRNIKDKAIYFDNCGGIQNAILVAKNENVMGNYGVYITGSDCLFNSIVSVNYVIAIHNDGADNFFQHIHPWNSHIVLGNGVTDYKQTIGFETTKPVHISDYYADSVYLGFKFTSNSEAISNIDSYNYYNNNAEIPLSDFEVGGIVTDLHKMFDANAPARLNVGVVKSLQYWGFPAIKISDNMGTIIINDSSFDLGYFMISADISNIGNSFRVTDRSQPLYSILPNDVKNFYTDNPSEAVRVTVSRISNNGFADLGRSLWICSYYHNGTDFWYSLGKPTTSAKWLKMPTSNDFSSQLSLAGNFASAQYLGKSPSINDLPSGVFYYDGWSVVPTNGTAPFTNAMGIWNRIVTDNNAIVDIVFHLSSAKTYISKDHGNTWTNS